ncbi:NUMOD4 domain-containing protein [Gracilibacillus dipsosauri]|uniref:NUMOD4 domain-containing protein n=1 Tax=Gracilibacillus dipsosauri TaxID=178340 RepID=UPI0024093BC9
MYNNTVEEIWKDVKGFEGLYKISNKGRVFSVKKGIFKKTKHNNRKYVQICLNKHGKQHHFLLHRLVAEHFIPNPNNLPQVNHKDENKENNCADNLEWCTNRYNANYGTKIERTINNDNYKKSRMKMKRSVIGTSLDGNIKIRLAGINDGELLGFNKSAISNCVRGETKYYKGFKWEYEN